MPVIYLALLTKKKQAKGSSSQAGKLKGEREKGRERRDSTLYRPLNGRYEIPPCSQALKYIWDVTGQEVTSDVRIAFAGTGPQ